ncbi:hypothetical protein GUJ93_ZPchr0009g2081 [Zizania palustris]|uniref:Uncharacterized protein n=1 Tax=Zizania palustris TaxID=103762 RepID=A0A8J5RRQ0_ZIZPA|nr:hypothetical protein GUJ93_ZPchr0009g2081 [Zizania palustris]
MGPTTLPSPPLLPRTRRRRRVLVRDGGADRPASGRRPSSPSAFLRRRRPLLAAHVVNFLKDRVWEMVERLLISHVAFRMCSGMGIGHTPCPCWSIGMSQFITRFHDHC